MNVKSKISTGYFFIYSILDNSRTLSFRFNQSWRSVTFWCRSGSGSPDLYLWQMDPDPTLDLTPFFSDFKDTKKLFFSYFFSYNLPTGTLSSVLKILFFAKVLCYNFILQALFQSAQHIYEKREGSGSGPLTNGSGSGRPKNMRGSKQERILWIQFGIRIPNTGFTRQKYWKTYFSHHFSWIIQSSGEALQHCTWVGSSTSTSLLGEVALASSGNRPWRKNNLITRVARWPWLRPNNSKPAVKKINLAVGNCRPWKWPWVVKTIFYYCTYYKAEFIKKIKSYAQLLETVIFLLIWLSPLDVVSMFVRHALPKTLVTILAKPSQARPGQLGPGEARRGEASPGQARPGRPRPARPSPAQPSPAQPSPAAPAPAPAPPSPAQPTAQLKWLTPQAMIRLSVSCEIRWTVLTTKMALSAAFTKSSTDCITREQSITHI